MVLRLVTSFFCHTIAIWKFNNITINCLTHPQLSVILDKSWFNTSLDWEWLWNDFDGVSLDTKANGILQALHFDFSPLNYFEKRILRFANVTDKSELAIKPNSIDNDQPIRKSNNKKVIKILNCAAKKKIRRNNFRAYVWALAIEFVTLLLFCHRSPTLLLSCFMLTSLSYPVTTLLFCLMPTLLSFPMLALLSCLVPALLSHFVPALFFLVYTLATKSPLFAFVFYPRAPIILLSYLILGLSPTHFISSALRIFKQDLPDKYLRCCLTSFVKSFCLFLSLGLLPKKSKCKWYFNTIFINSCLLAGNHFTKEVNLSFALYKCYTPVKLN